MKVTTGRDSAPHRIESDGYSDSDQTRVAGFLRVAADFQWLLIPVFEGVVPLAQFGGVKAQEAGRQVFVPA